MGGLHQGWSGWIQGGGGGGGDEGDQPPFDFDNKNLKSRTLLMPSSSAGCDGPFCSRK